jgi:hypothetical protein
MPPCTFPIDDYVFGMAVATKKGFGLLQTLVAGLKP